MQNHHKIWEVGLPFRYLAEFPTFLSSWLILRKARDGSTSEFSGCRTNCQQCVMRCKKKTDVHCHVKRRGQGSWTLFLRGSLPLFFSTCLAPRAEGTDKETAAVSHHVGQTLPKFCRHQVDSVSLSSFSSCLSFVCMNQQEGCHCPPFPFLLGVRSAMMNQLWELPSCSGKILKIA